MDTPTDPAATVTTAEPAPAGIWQEMKPPPGSKTVAASLPLMIGTLKVQPALVAVAGIPAWLSGEGCRNTEDRLLRSTTGMARSASTGSARVRRRAHTRR